ncbi:GNAT family N-acetyltransferase [Arthrobacter echini]|uniref:GNAT family N-acetyltransferase n=1 Tax=Arthrobacter echini TaxID=1529066 RepID=A0A5D0XRT1_9MICC|nr:GNAT family N-acetyltransferase [Arthrobacter echini]TYC99151.1 GNAT family N-acetyltransferase [Arthrobacter echini]
MTEIDRLARFLAAYDDQLRTDAEILGAITVTRHHALHLVTFMHGRGFVTYKELGEVGAESIPRIVGDVVAHYRANPEIRLVEWKTRGHDHAPGLHEALLENGFVGGEPESIMIGEAKALSVEVPLPAEVTIRQVTDEPDVRSASAMQDEVFGNAVTRESADALLRQLSAGDGTELWVAEAKGQIVCAGRLEPVPETEFAGIWGGATRKEWRGHGIYRALTARRAQSAIERGKTLIHSDSTEYSRPILERSGLVKVSTTTPYLWRR